MTEQSELAEHMVDKLVELMTHLTDEQRLVLMNAVTEKFCEHCGREQPAAQRCQCWNDE